jgi:hypothetical protein
MTTTPDMSTSSPVAGQWLCVVNMNLLHRGYD